MLFLPLSSIIFWSYRINFYRYGPVVRVTRRVLLTIALLSLVAATKTIPAAGARISPNASIMTIFYGKIVLLVINRYYFFNKVIEISDSRPYPN